MKYLFALSLLVVKLIPGTISFTEAQDPEPEAPVMETFTMKGGTLDPKTGSATISGTYACTGDEINHFYVSVNVNQIVGRRDTIYGSNGFSADFDDICNGDTHSWSVNVRPDRGKFAGGKALVSAWASVCDENWDYCCYGDVEQLVQLKGGPKI
jgi:hypothetical protein